MDAFRHVANKFYSKISFTVYSIGFKYEKYNLKAYVQYKCTCSDQGHQGSTKIRVDPPKYFSMLSVFNLLKLLRVFTLFVGSFFKAGKNAKLYYVTSNIL